MGWVLCHRLGQCNKQVSNQSDSNRKVGVSTGIQIDLLQVDPSYVLKSEQSGDGGEWGSVQHFYWQEITCPASLLKNSS